MVSNFYEGEWMNFKVEEVGGIGEYTEKEGVFSVLEGKAFLVVHKNTIEVRTDANLQKLLMEKYESVMQSRYFGKNGIEIVLAGQLDLGEIYDLVRLSYNLTKDLEEVKIA